MKILFLTQYFPPEMGAPQARISELAVRLKKKGYEITILTAMPNYPTGKVFSGYQGIRKIEEDFQGMRVLRCWIYPSKSTSIIARLISYFSFVISSMYYGRSIDKQDVIVVESPPLFLGLSGIVLSRVMKAKMIFNVSDLWPSSAVELGVVSDGILVRLAIILEKYCYRQAQVITGQSPSIVETIRKLMPTKKVELITNGVDVTLFSPDRKDKRIREKYGLAGKFVFVYAGLFGIAQGIGQVLDIAGRFKHTEAVFLLIGDGPESDYIRNRVISEDLTNVIIVPPLSKQEIPAVLASMDVAIIPLKTEIKGAVPSKIYEAMASGLPILFIGRGDGAEIIAKAAAGLVVIPKDLTELHKAVEFMLKNPDKLREFSNNGISCARANFSRDMIADRFETIIKHLTPR